MFPGTICRKQNCLPFKVSISSESSMMGHYKMKEVNFIYEWKEHACTEMKKYCSLIKHSSLLNKNIVFDKFDSKKEKCSDEI